MFILICFIECLSTQNNVMCLLLILILLILQFYYNCSIFRSFVPPVRDDESETQRKAHAKRVRETRRSTQGVTLDELKSAEQLVKKKSGSNNDTAASKNDAEETSKNNDEQNSSVSNIFIYYYYIFIILIFCKLLFRSLYGTCS